MKGLGHDLATWLVQIYLVVCLCFCEGVFVYVCVCVFVYVYECAQIQPLLKQINT